MPAKKAPAKTPPKPLYYACEHGQSNTPCMCHAIAAGHPLPTMPDDWYLTHGHDMPPGLSDALSGVPTDR